MSAEPTPDESTDPQELRQPYVEWIDSSLKDVYDLVYAKRWWYRLGEIVDANPDLPNEDNFYAVLGDWYAHYLAIGIRRHADRSGDSKSMRRLLEEIRDRPLLTITEAELDSAFDEDVPGASAEEIAERLGDDWPRVHLERLITSSDPIRRYVNKHVAHITRVESPATFAELHAALDALVEAALAAEYALTGKGIRRETFENAKEQFDWARVLRTTWVTDEVWAAMKQR